MGEKELPEGWVYSRLGDVTTKPQYGWTSKAGFTGRVKYLRTTDLSKGKVDWNNVPFCLYEPDDIEKYQLQKDDIVISRAGTVGLSFRIKEVPNDAVFASYLIRFKPILVESKFIEYFLLSADYWNEITEASAGIAVQNINAPKISNISIPLPPLAEQNRIVEKLDKLFASIEIVKTKLDTIPQLLKKFRQAVLSQAVTGKLTEKWREGKELGEWKEVILNDICQKITDGDHQSPPKSDIGIPFIVISDISKSDLALGNVTRFVPLDYYDALQEYRKPRKNDILYTVTGSFGIPVLVESDDPFCFQRHIGLVRPDEEKILPKLLFYYLKSDIVFNQAVAVATGTAQLTVPLGGLRKFVFNIPLLQEQQKILSRVENLFVKADIMEKKYQVLKAQIDNLPQAILSKAFKGELVPQDPIDESASELLERIKEIQSLSKKISKLTQVVA